MSPVLHCGFYNYVRSNEILAVLDARLTTVKRLIAEVKKAYPDKVLDVTRGRKRLSVVVLTNETFLLSALPTRKLANRLGIEDGEED